MIFGGKLENSEQDNIEAQTSAGGEEVKTIKSRKPIFIAAAVIGGGIAVAALLFAFSGPTKLEAAVEDCFLESNASVSLDEDGKGLYLDGQGDENPGLSIEDTVCVLRALDVPDSVTSRMSNTTSLMGQQVADWDEITVMWTYHPNNGLDISLELK